MSQDPNPPNSTDSFAEFRKEIDQIDSELIRLLSRRAECAIEIGKLKGLTGKPFFTPERERMIFQILKEKNPGPLSYPQLKAIFREVISAARAAELPLTIAFWGPEGTFSNSAAIKIFGNSCTFLPCGSISEVFRATEIGQANYGVVPVENSVGGMVTETLDCFPECPLKICSEVTMKIEQNLASLCTELGEIERIYSGPQPTAQCRHWIRENLPNAQVIDVSPTSAAAQRALEDPKSAAIVNQLSAQILALPILAEHIHDNSLNRTRFLVIGSNEPSPSGRDKTSLLLNLGHKPGELYRALGAFMAYGVNLQLVESRPHPRGDQSYLFFIDCDGHKSDTSVAGALDGLLRQGIAMNLLGSYPVSLWTD